MRTDAAPEVERLEMPPPVPPPIVEPCPGRPDILLLRDDLVLGGSKRRVARHLLDGWDEWVFAGPAQGHAQLALALACRENGKQATFFTAQRSELLPISRQAIRWGLKLVMVPAGRLNVVQAAARRYCESCGARFIALGLAIPGMEDGIVTAAQEVRAVLESDPPQVWCVAGSGTLARALARAFPESEIHAVIIGKPPILSPGIVTYEAPERFEEPAELLPPFDSNVNYDAKAWRFLEPHAAPGALFWNVAGAV